MPQEQRGVSRLATAPDGVVLAPGSVPNEVGIWRLDGGGEYRGYVGFLGHVRDIAVSSDGRIVAVAGVDATTTVFRRGTDRLGHPSAVNDFVVDRTGQRLASVATDGLLRLWDLTTRTLHATVEPDGPPVHAAFSPDGTLAVTTGAGTVELRDPAGSLRATLRVEPDDPAGAVAFSPDGKLLAVASGQNDVYGSTAYRIHVWDTETAQLRGVIETGPADPKWLGFTPDGRRLVAVTNSAELTLASLTWSAEVVTWRTGDLGLLSRHQIGEFSVVDASMSPDGKRLAVAGTNREIELRSVDGAVRLADALAPHTSTVREVAFSADGKTLATSTVHDTYVRLWDAETGQLRARLSGHTHGANELLFIGDQLVSGSADSSIAFWQLDPQVAVRQVCTLAVPAARSAGEEPPAACLGT